MKFERKLSMTGFDRAYLEKLLKDYIHLKKPEFKRSRLTDDKNLLLFAEQVLQEIQ